MEGAWEAARPTTSRLELAERARELGTDPPRTRRTGIRNMQALRKPKARAAAGLQGYQCAQKARDARERGGERQGGGGVATPRVARTDPA